MAIQVGGTTVIDDSRNFTNIAGGFKTVNGSSVVGSGDISAGASTTAGAVGTYIIGRPANYTNYVYNNTASGLYGLSVGYSEDRVAQRYINTWRVSGTIQSMSGTWRCMSPAGQNGTSAVAHPGLWVRIS